MFLLQHPIRALVEGDESVPDEITADPGAFPANIYRRGFWADLKLVLDVLTVILKLIICSGEFTGHLQMRSG